MERSDYISSLGQYEKLPTFPSSTCIDLLWVMHVYCTAAACCVCNICCAVASAALTAAVWQIYSTKTEPINIVISIPMPNNQTVVMIDLHLQV